MSDVPELSPEQWAEAEELFARAAVLPADQRDAFLQQECGVEAVRREVASLLDHALGAPLIAADAIAYAAAALAREMSPDERLIGARLGSYRLEAIAGYGGMGAVYRAFRDDDEFHQRVAIKLVRAAAESPAAQHRFRQERQILARLSHPNIARLLDGGSTPENIPYLVMEFVEGEPVTSWCDRLNLGLEERVRIFLPVCDGVEAANRELVIHRDLKPVNILVTREGIPKLLDFGIAKLLNADTTDAGYTATRTQVMMTPEYASPEQVRGEQVTPATDVYSLGLVLYELLTGRKAQAIPDHTPETIVKIVCQAEPIKPALLKTRLSGDLDNIIRKAIRKEPARRYQSAAELSLELIRYLEGRPVLARPDTFTYRASKFLRRNSTAAKTGIVSAISVFGGLALVYWLAAPSRPPRVLQVVQLTQIGRVEIGGEVASNGSNLFFTERVGGRWSLAQVPVTGGTPSPWPTPLVGPSIMGISPDRSRLLISAEPETNEEEALWVQPIAGGPPHRVGNMQAFTASWSRDGDSIFYESGPNLFVVQADGSGLRKLAYIPDKPYGVQQAPAEVGDILRFSRSRNDMRSSSIWEIHSDGSGLHPLFRTQDSGKGWPDGEYAGAWTSSGRYYLYSSREGSTYRFWALPERRGPFALLPSHPVQIYSTPLTVFWLTPSLNDKRIYFAAGQERRELVRYDHSHAQFIPFLAGASGRHVSFSSDQRQVAYTTVPDDILWKSRADGTGRVALTTAAVRAFRPSWSPDGTLIAFSGYRLGQSSRLFVIPSGGGTPEEIATTPFAENASWSPDGKSILFSGYLPGDVRRFGLYTLDWKTRKPEFISGSEDLAYSSWAPGGRFIAATGFLAGLRLFDRKTQHWSHLADAASGSYPFWSRDGKYIYFQHSIGPEDQPIFRMRVVDGKVERLMSVKQILQSDVTGYSLCGLAPDDAPIASVIRSNSDIYALDVDLP